MKSCIYFFLHAISIVRMWIDYVSQSNKFGNSEPSDTKNNKIPDYVPNILPKPQSVLFASKPIYAPTLTEENGILRPTRVVVAYSTDVDDVIQEGLDEMDHKLEIQHEKWQREIINLQTKLRIRCSPDEHSAILDKIHRIHQLMCNQPIKSKKVLPSFQIAPKIHVEETLDRLSRPLSSLHRLEEHVTKKKEEQYIQAMSLQSDSDVLRKSFEYKRRVENAIRNKLLEAYLKRLHTTPHILEKSNMKDFERVVSQLRRLGQPNPGTPSVESEKKRLKLQSASMKSPLKQGPDGKLRRDGTMPNLTPHVQEPLPGFSDSDVRDFLSSLFPQILHPDDVPPKYPEIPATGTCQTALRIAENVMSRSDPAGVDSALKATLEIRDAVRKEQEQRREAIKQHAENMRLRAVAAKDVGLLSESFKINVPPPPSDPHPEEIANYFAYPSPQAFAVTLGPSVVKNYSLYNPAASDLRDALLMNAMAVEGEGDVEKSKHINDVINKTLQQVTSDANSRLKQKQKRKINPNINSDFAQRPSSAPAASKHYNGAFSFATKDSTRVQNNFGIGGALRYPLPFYHPHFSKTSSLVDVREPKRPGSASCLELQRDMQLKSRLPQTARHVKKLIGLSRPSSSVDDFGGSANSKEKCSVLFQDFKHKDLLMPPKLLSDFSCSENNFEFNKNHNTQLVDCNNPQTNRIQSAGGIITQKPKKLARPASAPGIYSQNSDLKNKLSSSVSLSELVRNGDEEGEVSMASKWGVWKDHSATKRVLANTLRVHETANIMLNKLGGSSFKHHSDEVRRIYQIGAVNGLGAGCRYACGSTGTTHPYNHKSSVYIRRHAVSLPSSPLKRGDATWQVNDPYEVNRLQIEARKGDIFDQQQQRPVSASVGDIAASIRRMWRSGETDEMQYLKMSRKAHSKILKPYLKPAFPNDIVQPNKGEMLRDIQERMTQEAEKLIKGAPLLSVNLSQERQELLMNGFDPVTHVYSENYSGNNCIPGDNHSSSSKLNTINFAKVKISDEPISSGRTSNLSSHTQYYANSTLGGTTGKTAMPASQPTLHLHSTSFHAQPSDLLLPLNRDPNLLSAVTPVVIDPHLLLKSNSNEASNGESVALLVSPRYRDERRTTHLNITAAQFVHSSPSSPYKEYLPIVPGFSKSKHSSIRQPGKGSSSLHPSEFIKLCNRPPQDSSAKWSALMQEGVESRNGGNSNDIWEVKKNENKKHEFKIQTTVYRTGNNSHNGVSGPNLLTKPLSSSYKSIRSLYSQNPVDSALDNEDKLISTLTSKPIQVSPKRRPVTLQSVQPLTNNNTTLNPATSSAPLFPSPPALPLRSRPATGHSSVSYFDMASRSTGDFDHMKDLKYGFNEIKKQTRIIQGKSSASLVETGRPLSGLRTSFSHTVLSVEDPPCFPLPKVSSQRAGAIKVVDRMIDCAAEDAYVSKKNQQNKLINSAPWLVNTAFEQKNSGLYLPQSTNQFRLDGRQKRPVTASSAALNLKEQRMLDPKWQSAFRPAGDPLGNLKDWLIS